MKRIPTEEWVKSHSVTLWLDVGRETLQWDDPLFAVLNSPLRFYASGIQAFTVRSLCTLLSPSDLSYNTIDLYHIIIEMIGHYSLEVLCLKP
jgi:hypothetical protein